MTTTSAGIEQLTNVQLGRDSRPLAALAVSPGDLPNGLIWTEDETEQTCFTIVGVNGDEFALEFDERAPEKQTTVYGSEAGEALDRLVEALGLDDRAVIDRVDQERPELSVPETAELARYQRSVQKQVEKLQKQLSRQLAEVERLFAVERDEERKAAAAALELTEDLTERERKVLSLAMAGFTTEEIARLLEVKPRTVRDHHAKAMKRSAISGRYSSSRYAKRSPSKTVRSGSSRTGRSRRSKDTGSKTSGSDTPG